MNYELIIKNILKESKLEIELVSDTNNKVFKVKTANEILYAKFYSNSSAHIDNELKVYDLVANKYLKELIYKSESPRIAIFKELVGKTIDELSAEELEDKSDLIVESVVDYFEKISIHKVKGYGILDENLNGKYSDFFEFLKIRQSSTSLILKDYPELNGIFDLIMKKYKDIIVSDNSLVPIDTNLKNIMVLNDGSIKFVDPGEMISAPILMGYGDFASHTYKTILYDKLMQRLKLNDKELKLLRIYAVFSSLNILAFLKNHGVTELNKVIPYGNKYTFYELINEHLKYLDLK